MFSRFFTTISLLFLFSTFTLSTNRPGSSFDNKDNHDKDSNLITPDASIISNEQTACPVMQASSSVNVQIDQPSAKTEHDENKESHDTKTAQQQQHRHYRCPTVFKTIISKDEDGNGVLSITALAPRSAPRPTPDFSLYSRLGLELKQNIGEEDAEPQPSLQEFFMTMPMLMVNASNRPVSVNSSYIQLNLDPNHEHHQFIAAYKTQKKLSKIGTLVEKAYHKIKKATMNLQIPSFKSLVNSSIKVFAVLVIFELVQHKYIPKK